MGTFSGLTDLRNLNIRNNTLTHLHKDLFSDLEKLIKLGGQNIKIWINYVLCTLLRPSMEN
jgi:hypothetical protein